METVIDYLPSNIAVDAPDASPDHSSRLSDPVARGSSQDSTNEFRADQPSKAAPALISVATVTGSEPEHQHTNTAGQTESDQPKGSNDETIQSADGALEPAAQLIGSRISVRLRSQTRDEEAAEAAEQHIQEVEKPE